MSIQAVLFGTPVPLTATISPGASYGSRWGAGTATTGNVTATPFGGVPGYTHAWTYVSGDAVFTASSGTAATTHWTCTLTIGSYKEAVWQYVATDSVGTASPPVYINVSAEEVNFS
jgi:hypothetical protein